MLVFRKKDFTVILPNCLRSEMRASAREENEPVPAWKLSTESGRVFLGAGGFVCLFSSSTRYQTWLYPDKMLQSTHLAAT